MPRFLNRYLLTFIITCIVQWTFAESEVNPWQEVVIIDVRTEQEWQSGHLEGAIWIPWTQIEAGVAAHNIGKDQTLAFYCAAGVRANRAIRKLRSLGYERLINLVSVQQAAATTGRAIIVPQ